jgi:hypothetical protein
MKFVQDLPLRGYGLMLCESIAMIQQYLCKLHQAHLTRHMYRRALKASSSTVSAHNELVHLHATIHEGCIETTSMLGQVKDPDLLNDK